MRAVDDHYGYLMLDGDPLKGAQEAFSAHRYVEAFALLHAEIDWWMIDLYQLSEYPSASAKKSVEGLKAVAFLLTEQGFRFKSTLSYLARKHIVDGKEQRRLLKFNELRDRIIHRLVIYSHQRAERNRVDVKEAREGFEEGVRLAILLRGKSGEMIRKFFPPSGASS